MDIWKHLSVTLLHMWFPKRFIKKGMFLNFFKPKINQNGLDSGILLCKPHGGQQVTATAKR